MRNKQININQLFLRVYFCFYCKAVLYAFVTIFVIECWLNVLNFNIIPQTTTSQAICLDKINMFIRKMN